MVTKAELEQQVAELKRQLAEYSRNEKPIEHRETNDQQTPDHEMISEAWAENLRHLPGQIEDVLTELEDLPHKKPILFALGVFALGYLIGRSR